MGGLSCFSSRRIPTPMLWIQFPLTSWRTLSQQFYPLHPHLIKFSLSNGSFLSAYKHDIYHLLKKKKYSIGPYNYLSISSFPFISILVILFSFHLTWTLSNQIFPHPSSEMAFVKTSSNFPIARSSANLWSTLYLIYHSLHLDFLLSASRTALSLGSLAPLLLVPIPLSDL